MSVNGPKSLEELNKTLKGDPSYGFPLPRTWIVRRWKQHFDEQTNNQPNKEEKVRLKK